MTDLELARLRANAAGFLADALDLGVSTLTRERSAVFAQLFAELDTARSEHAALREIVTALATTNVLAYEGDAGDWVSCPFAQCTGEDDYRNDDIELDGRFRHSADCPVTKARALLSETGGTK